MAGTTDARNAGYSRISKTRIGTTITAARTLISSQACSCGFRAWFMGYRTSTATRTRATIPQIAPIVTIFIAGSYPP